MIHFLTLRQCLGFGLAWMVALAVAVAAPSQSPPASNTASQVVRVIDTRGKVDVLQGPRRFTARAQQPLLPKDRVQTFTNSHANLLWYDRMVFQVSELSDFAIPPPPGATKPATLEFFKGLLYFFHRDQPGKFELRTPTAAAIVLGTEFSARVADDGTTTILLFDGEIEITTPQGGARMRSGEQGVIAPGQRPVVTPIVQAVNDLIQWFLYYPGVLDVNEAGLTPAEEQALAASLAAYRGGDLREALAAYPTGRQPVSDAERLYVAALFLTIGQVDRAENLLAAAGGNDRSVALAASLKKMIDVVKGRTNSANLDPQLATARLVDSYRHQARGDLEAALAAATESVSLAPKFGFGWARVAELQFSFGRTRQALAAAEHSLELSPRNAQALALKGFLLTAQNRVVSAEDLFDQALQLDGGLGNAWLGRGLCRIRRGRDREGREDLFIAAAVEPQRAVLRSYLGKALSDAGEPSLALEELRLARQLDTNDPTGWLYSALLRHQQNEINDAVRDLERAQSLGENRHIYRSDLLLDQDRAVRGANLANLYYDAGLIDLSVREATRAVNADYGNYSAHLFLANSYDRLRDPNGVSLRYESPWAAEYFIANLLAPVGAGVLSPTVTQQEYSKLFERQRFGFVSSTEYFSNGDWSQSAAQFGLVGNLSYTLEGSYRRRNGQQPNNELEQWVASLQLKYQITPSDTIFVQPIFARTTGGDLTPYYDPANANRGAHFREEQEPLLLAGYRHEWSPEHQTLLAGGYIRDTLETHNPLEPLLLLNNQVGFIEAMAQTTATNDYRLQLKGALGELQHIARLKDHTLVAGARGQIGSFDATSDLGQSAPVNVGFVPNVSQPPTSSDSARDFSRLSGYLYDYWQVAEPLILNAGISYDYLEYPANFRTPPLSREPETREQWSPKAGFIWQPWKSGTLRAGYSRSLGGASLDQSLRIEPTQVAGFNQTFRSLIPEAVAGIVPAEKMDTIGVLAEQRFASQTYVALELEWLRSKAEQELGAVQYNNTFPPLVNHFAHSNTLQRLRYDERSVALSVSQLIGPELSLGLRYRISQAELSARYPELPDAAAAAAGFDTSRDLEAVLHQIHLFALYNSPSGFFAQLSARWYSQHNAQDASSLLDDTFWQFDAFAGYRFPNRRAELRLGILNLGDQDYRLNPLNLLGELPRQRTFTAKFTFNF